MTVRLSDDGGVELVGDCPSGDAEALLQHLVRAPKPIVDWTACTATHTAVIQVLMAAKVAMKGPPADSFLADVVAPLLKQR